MTPTVGRIVHYYPTEQEAGAMCLAEYGFSGPLAGLVTGMQPDGVMTLTVFAPMPYPSGDGRTVASLFAPVHAESEGVEPGCWSWPPRA